MIVYDVTCENSFDNIKDWIRIVEDVSNIMMLFLL